MTGNAILESLCTMSSAKTLSLQEDGRGIMSTPTDAVIMACEGEATHCYAGSVTAVGSRLTECVRRGVPLALSRYEAGAAAPVVIDVKAPPGDGNGE